MYLNSPKCNCIYFIHFSLLTYLMLIIIAYTHIVLQTLQGLHFFCNNVTPFVNRGCYLSPNADAADNL